jgi:hypothetical protein
MKRTLIFGSALLIIFVILFLIGIIVNRANEEPVAENSSVMTQEDTPISIDLVGSDSDGDSLSFHIVTKPSHGGLQGTNRKIIYTPDKNFNGSDDFTFKVSDGSKDSATATVTITVTAVNDPPVAVDDSVKTQEDTPVVMVDVLANDTDIDDDEVVLLGVTQGKNGSVTISTNNVLTYTANKNFCGTDSFSYTISDGKGGTDTAVVELAVAAVNDPPVITSKPVTTTRVWSSYSYDVNAKDPDIGDTLTYSLSDKPDGMTIDPNTGLIKWRPDKTQQGTYEVTVKVADSNDVPASDVQSFSVIVASLSSPLITPLTVEDGYDAVKDKKLSEENKLYFVLSSDNKFIETGAHSSIFFDFSDASIPEGGEIISVVVFVEHFEDEQFPFGKLQWNIGSGWPDEPVVWKSINAPVRDGQRNKSTDSWDITSIVNTSEKVDRLQFQIANNSNIAGRKTSLDYIYIIVRWY